MIQALLITVPILLSLYRVLSGRKSEAFGYALFFSWLIGACGFIFLPFAGDYDTTKTIPVDSDSIANAYDPEEDSFAVVFEGTDGKTYSVNINEDYGVDLALGDEAELSEVCPTTIPWLTLYTYPVCEWTLYTTAK